MMAARQGSEQRYSRSVEIVDTLYLSIIGCELVGPMLSAGTTRLPHVSVEGRISFATIFRVSRSRVKVDLELGAANVLDIEFVHPITSTHDAEIDVCLTHGQVVHRDLGKPLR